MAVNWDVLITGGVLLAIVLAAWAKLTQQTIKELLTDIRDFIVETREAANERGEELIYYE